MKQYKLHILLSILYVTGCTKEFIVKDIKNEYVTVLAPADNLSTPQNSITFWWEKMEGADKYQIQIVKPSFNSILQLIVDTNVAGDKFNIALTPGTYQWRIRGVNTAGSSQFGLFNLTIDTTSNLAQQVVVPVLPVQNYLTGVRSINFSWNSISSATEYQIVITSSLNAIVKDTTTMNNYLNTTLFSGGQFTWKVRAFNAYSISQYNISRSFTIDVTAPAVSTIISPTNGSHVKDTTSLRWTRATSDTKYDSLFIALDSTFTSMVVNERVYSNKIELNSLSQTLSTSITYYYWKVKSIDSVGNRSGFSNQLKFKLIP